MNIYFKGYRIFNLIFKPSLELISLFEDLNDDPNKGTSLFSIRSKILPYPEDTDVNNKTEFTSFIRIEFGIKDGALNKREMDFSFVHIVELITDVNPVDYITDPEFVKQANQIAYVALTNFIVNFLTNCGYNPFHIPLAKIES